MPSAQSDALRAAFQSMTDRLAANPEMDLPALREMLEALSVCAGEPTDVTYEDVEAGGRPAIWCIPAGAAADRVILYVHGGGFVCNSPSSHRKMVGHLAKAAGVRALALDYRLAPENPYPAQLEDAVAAFDWLQAQGIAPQHIATAGDSAGGNLATTIALKLRDDGKELPGAVIGFSPWYDMEATGKTMDSNAETDALVQRPLLLNMAAMFLGEKGKPTDPLCNPLYADPTGLPPMFLSAGGAETLLDNAERFADTAGNAGVDVTLETSDGQQHVYPFMAGRAPEADETVANAGRWVRSKLGL